MSNSYIWRLTNNGTAGAGNNTSIGDLPANQVIDLPAELVSVFWDSDDGEGSTIEQLRIQNQSLSIISTSSNTGITEIRISSSGANNVARAQLVDVAIGKVLFDTNT